jgi:hypothetical protein
MDTVKEKEDMYYNRTLVKLAPLLLKDGKLRWLFEFVKNRSDLDFLVGRNRDSEWISIYRGLSRMITINPSNDSHIKLTTAQKYKPILHKEFWENKRSIDEPFENELELLISKIESNKEFDRYYKSQHLITGKEGYYQNELSRKFGICGDENTEFVIVDKEAVIGYDNQQIKDELFSKIRQKYRALQARISFTYAEVFGSNLEKKAMGSELDFLAVDRNGNILLIEYKHGTNTSGIYLSPLQIGLYQDIFTNYPWEKLSDAVTKMLEQKKKMGLINPDWKTIGLSGKIIPVLIISDYNYGSTAKKKFHEILKISRQEFGDYFLKDLQTFNYTTKSGLTPW